MDLAKETRDRIFVAADSLYEQAGRAAFPTVDAVRKTAKVNMNDASAGMKEWRRAQTAQASPVAVLVPEAVQQASSAALAALWHEAQELANESLRAAQAGWDAERAEADTLNKQMADAYEDQATELLAAQGRIAELEAAAQQAAGEIAGVRQELEEAGHALMSERQRAAVAEQRAEEIERRAADLRTELDRARQDLQGARQEVVQVRGELAEARAAIEGTRGELATVKAKAEAQAEAHQEQRKATAQETARQAERFTRVQAERDDAVKEAGQAREAAATLRGQVEAVREQNAQLMQAVQATGKATPKGKNG